MKSDNTRCGGKNSAELGKIESQECCGIVSIPGVNRPNIWVRVDLIIERTWREARPGENRPNIRVRSRPVTLNIPGGSRDEVYLAAAGTIKCKCGGIGTPSIHRLTSNLVTKTTIITSLPARTTQKIWSARIDRTKVHLHHPEHC